MKDYLFKKNLTVKKFAADLEISTSYLYQLLRGERTPSRQLAYKIEKYTEGELTVKELLDKALQKKLDSDKKVDVQKELEEHEKRLLSLEDRLSKIEMEVSK